ncbi:MAG: RNA methyltransferase [Thermodesulfobacterium sp.]|jgi:tRNA/rRNA methyltransferase|nr:RNA methyltransferase [Thermodesulfobacterium sp.]
MQVYPIATPKRANLKNFSVILVNPLYPENIGAAARACANFGVDDLRVVNPASLEELPMTAMATKQGEEVLQKMKIFSSLEQALADLNFVVGTTGRLGKRRLVFHTLREFAPYLCELSFKNKIGLVFGNERLGLSNEELMLCHEVITIPTTEKASLNLAQSVILVLYELFQTACEFHPERLSLATHEELELLFKMIEETLKEIDYMPHDNPTLWLTNIRRFITRREPTSREVKIMMGFCRQLLWRLGKELKLSLQDEQAPQGDSSEGTCQKDKAPEGQNQG